MALQFKAVDMANFLSLHAKPKANLQKIRGLLQKELHERFDETMKAGDDLEKELSAGGASSKEVDHRPPSRRARRKQDDPTTRPLP